MNANSGFSIEFRPSERADIFKEHGIIAFVGGIGILMAVVPVISSIVGWLFDLRSLIFLDPFCGIPGILFFALQALILSSGLIVASADGTINEQGITTYILGFRYLFPWDVIRTGSASRHKLLPDMPGFQRGKDEDIFLIYLDHLPIIHRFAAWFYSLQYKRRCHPLFVVTPKYDGYSDFLRLIEQMDSSD